ncbi:hypothetical protein AB0K43_30925 [Kitasatospora sp. NPDC049258]|uniref:hypothetical protein n=1 Tax=Kitasatospora sp. NPDC049258 TaxID=3155394 RepID=UPI003414465F
MNTRPAHCPLRFGPVDQFLAEAALDPRMRLGTAGPHTAGDSLTVLTVLRAALELRHRRMLTAAPRRRELTGGPRRTAVLVDEAAQLLARPGGSGLCAETLRLVGEILAVGRSTRINA